MRKIFFGIISILVIAGLAWFFFWQKQLPATAPGEQVNETAEKGWIEVINRGAYLVNTDGTLGSELKTGDELTGGQTLMTDQTGLANLHFSDGSVARLETQTKVDLKDFEYFPGNKTLKVKIFLQSGRIWSRIKALMTTQSYWEVETSNAVAAVRGTSFGVVYVPGQTTIIGSVHLINVNAIDPQTKQLIEHNTAYVGEEQYIKINDQDIAGLKSEVKLTSKIKPYTQAIINDAWVIKSKSLDAELVGQSPTSTLIKPQADEDLNTKPLGEQTQPVDVMSEEKPTTTENVTNISSGSGQNSVSSPTSDQTTENDFYYSTDDPTHSEMPDNSSQDSVVGAAPDNVNDGSETTTDNSVIDPTHNSTVPEKTTTTINLKPSVNTRIIEPVR